ncbi:MAG: DNA polymerase III subunit epsilon [Alphaproteobacteria bacterium]
MREIVVDTETTGLDPQAGDRVVEIGCVELANHLPTGREFQVYLNPERDIPPAAQAIHGLSLEFLISKPRFAEIADSFLEFVGDAPLIMHNAEFDRGFLNAELERIGRAPLPASQVVDTVQIARRKHPGAPANLDALCRRFDIDTARRTRHGALLDAQLLAEVYLHLRGGRQPGLALASSGASATAAAGKPRARNRAPRPHTPSDDERAAHAAFVEGLSDPIWRR